MNKKIFAIKDVKSGFGNLYIEQNELVALRNFSQVCTDPKTQIYEFPEDFSLYCLGVFDGETGEIIASEPVKVAEAISYVPKVKPTSEN